jgi:hypothetical protein
MVLQLAHVYFQHVIIDSIFCEGRLTWLVYIIGAAVGGRVSFNSNDEHDAMDGELVCRVLQLMNLTDARLSQVTKQSKIIMSSVK